MQCPDREIIDLDALSEQPGFEAHAAAQALVTKAQLRWQLRTHVASQLYDESGSAAEGTAIYTLADPRDLKLTRYVGQTTVPLRRFVQHLNSARLWLPDERPWWIKSARLLPLYGWIRELYRDAYRLPTMVVREWITEGGRLAERRRIEECLAQQLPLLNVQSCKPAKRTKKVSAS